MAFASLTGLGKMWKRVELLCSWMPASIILSVNVQSFMSVIVYVYSPFKLTSMADSLNIVPFGVFQVTLYPGVPPVISIAMESPRVEFVPFTSIRLYVPVSSSGSNISNCAVWLIGHGASEDMITEYKPGCS